MSRLADIITSAMGRSLHNPVTTRVLAAAFDGATSVRLSRDEHHYLRAELRRDGGVFVVLGGELFGVRLDVQG